MVSGYTQIEIVKERRTEGDFVVDLSLFLQGCSPYWDGGQKLGTVSSVRVRFRADYIVEFISLDWIMESVS